MQENGLDDPLSRMRLQLLKDGHFSRLPGQQRDLGLSQGMGQQQQQSLWTTSLQSASSSPNTWTSGANGVAQAPTIENQAVDKDLPMSRTLGGSSDAWPSTAGSTIASVDGQDPGNGVWSGGFFANEPHNIWSGGVSSSPQQGSSLTAPSLGTGVSLGQVGAQTQPISHGQQFQLLAANGALGNVPDTQYNAGMGALGNLNSSLAGLNLNSDAYNSSGMQQPDAQYNDLDRGLFNTGMISNFNGLSALNGLDNSFSSKLQQPGISNGVGNGYNPMNGGLAGLNNSFNSLGLNGAAQINGGLDNAALAAKIQSFQNGLFQNGLNNSLAGLGGNALPNNGLVNGINYGGLGSMLQPQQQQQQQQLLCEQLQALGAANVAQLPQHLQQAYLRELLLQQQRRAALLAPHQPLPPLGAGQLPQQRIDLAGFRRDLQQRDLPMARQGSRNLPGAKGVEDGFLLGAQAELLKGLQGQHPPPPPPRMVNGRMQPPPPPPAQQAPNFPGRGNAQQKKVLASLLQRAPSRDKAYVPGAKPKAETAQLDKELLELVEKLRPTEEEKQHQAEALEAVRAALTRRWPDCKVHLFGSTANQLSICNNNDIDVCLELPDLPNDPNTKGEIVEELGELLNEAGMQNVLPLPKARVPVVKFVVGDNGTKVDITVNNILAIVNTKLLSDYAQIDERLVQLCYIIKHWAKRRQVNDSYRGTLSSYCYVLMCIHLLQQRQPPILPCLQAIKPPTHFRTVGQWVCDYFDDLERLKGFGAANKESLGELVWAFFEYWAWKHDYNSAVISVRTGGFLTKSQKEWTRRVGNERHLVCIEDPFELTHDLGRTVDRQTNGVLHKEFERAACVLRDHESPLEKLLEPYRAGKTG